MGKPNPPQPTDPVVAANAQAGANAETARLQANLNNVNSFGPYGSVVYDQTSPDRWTQYTTLSPTEQRLFDQSTTAQSGALNLANDQIGRINTALGQTLNPGYGMTMQGPQVGPIMSTVNPQNNQQDVGPSNFNQAVQGVQNAYYNQATSRLDPQWQQAQSQLQTQLANQGLNINDRAYQTAMQNFNQSKTDAYNQANFGAIGAGANEQNTLFGQQLQQGQFHNDAVNNDFQNRLASAQLSNSAEQLKYGQELQNSQFGNTAAQQYFQNQAYAQNQPINQFSALLGSGQVSMPGGVQYSPVNVQPTDVLGAYALNQQQRQANYQSQMGMFNGLMGGLFGLGSSAIMASDRRLKRDIVKLGELPDGLGVYAYRYLWSPLRHVGVMAQDVANLRPWALRSLGEWLAVDYGAL